MENWQNPVFYFELPANDMGRAKSFYENVFGWNVQCSYENYYKADTAGIIDGGGLSQISGTINGGIQKKDETIGCVRIVINVQNLDEALQKAIAEGGKIFIPKKKIPGMLYSVILDTEGNEINLVEAIK